MARNKHFLYLRNVSFALDMGTAIFEFEMVRSHWEGGRGFIHLLAFGSKCIKTGYAARGRSRSVRKGYATTNS